MYLKHFPIKTRATAVDYADAFALGEHRAADRHLLTRGLEPAWYVPGVSGIVKKYPKNTLKQTSQNSPHPRGVHACAFAWVLTRGFKGFYTEARVA
jgi:hypothetical protein